MTFTLTSAAFTDGGNIPVRYTCDGDEHIPGLAWSDAPNGTQSFALILHDPDTPKGDLTHWVLYDIPARTSALPERAAAASVGIAGTNSMEQTHYKGPCPPPGDKPHRYMFEFYALGVESLGLPPGAHRAEVEAAAQSHTLATARLLGHYERKKS